MARSRTPSTAASSPAPAQELRFAHVASGARIAWAASGQGPVLVRTASWMTHVGQDMASPIWQPWLERLGRSLRVVRYDERGCGLSGSDDVTIGLESTVEELSVVVDATAAAPVAVLALSGGAATAVAYAARHPERVSHLVLVGGYTHGLMHRQPSTQALQMHESLAHLIEHGWGQASSAVQQYFTAQLVPDASSEQVRSLNEQQRLSCDGRRAAAILRARVALDVRNEAPLVRCPTLVLHADGDLVVPMALGLELAAAIPGARFESLATRNHIPLAGTPAFEAFCDAVGRFVAGARQAGDPGFTPRQRELLALVARGMDNLQIAAHLGLADKTVRNALSHLYAAMGVEGRPQAVVKARELGYR